MEGLVTAAFAPGMPLLRATNACDDMLERRPQDIPIRNGALAGPFHDQWFPNRLWGCLT